MTAAARSRRLARVLLPLLGCGVLAATAVPVASASAARPQAASPVLPAPANDPSIDLTPGTQWYAGTDVESINPTQDMLDGLDGQGFYLGGYGFGDGQTAANQVDPSAPTYDSGRTALGILGDGVHTRAMALGDGRHAIVMSQIETQGFFIAYKQGDYGITDIRRDAAAQIAAIRAQDPDAGPPLPARAIQVDSDHTHGGPDTVGVWGGVPTSYLQEVHDQTVKAIVAAWRDLQPVTLTYGTAKLGVEGKAYDGDYPAGFDRLMTNQFSDDPNNQSVDDEMRVLRATSVATGKPVLTYVNAAMHPTVLDGDNRLVTGDWVGRADDAIEAAGGGFGFVQVGTLGREQPARGSCASAVNTGPDAGVPQLTCLDTYAARVWARAQQALAAAQPVSGPPLVAMSSYLIEDTSTNAIIISAEYGGFAAGIPLDRSQNAPWFTGNVLGTTVFAGRIGDILISGNPGEPYPQIVQAIRADVLGTDGKPLQGYISLGTAGDFLGYLIYPATAYPEPIRRSILSGNPPPAGDPNCSGSGIGSPIGCPDPIGNDNYFFNESMTIGQRLVCAGLRGADDMFADISEASEAKDTTCALPVFSGDAAFPAGYDTQFSSAGVTADVPASLPETPVTWLLLPLAAVAGAGAVLARRRRRTA